MGKKGQIVTIDLVFSMILLMLAIGYGFRIAEAANYSMKEEEIFKDLQRIGTAAGERLVSSADFICEVQGADFSMYNCLVATKVQSADRGALGIPPGYNFRLSASGMGDIGQSPPDPASDEEMVYSEERKVLWFNSDPSKADIDSCVSGIGCAGDERLVMLKVWRQ